MYETLSSILIDDLHLNASAVRPDASCADAGLDQLAMVELRMVLQERLNMDVNDDELMATKRVADIVRLLEEHANSATARTLY
jgi:acyl carrier protein